MAEQLTSKTPDIITDDNDTDAPRVGNGNNPNRGRGQGSRTRHNKARSGSDPRNKNKNTPKPNNKEKLSVDEIWAEDYIRENVNLFEDESDSAQALIETRSLLAETATAAREGGLLSNRKKEDALTQAKAQYESAKDEYIAHQLEAIASATADQRRAFIALLDSKERGALMGEEAYEYLATTEHASAFDRLVARYNDLPRAVKIAAGVGIAATTATVAGFAAGGAAAGVALSGRFGRGYFSEEAKRRKGGKQTLQERQQNATLRQGNYDDYKHTHDELKDARASRPFERIDSALLERAKKTDEELHDRTDAQIEAERLRESKMKRKAVGKAALIGAAGYGIGRLAPEVFDFFSGGDEDMVETDGAEDSPGRADEEIQDRVDNLENQIETETETSQDLTDQYEQEIQRQQDLIEEIEEIEDTPAEDGGVEDEATAEISERSQYLYGELAGEEVSVTIPEGGNIWNQLETVVDEQMPSVTGDEKQRIVGNMLNVMEEEYPGRDLNLVQPGEEFSIEIPA